jgi:outer membrane protein assembly factor BamB
MLKRTCLVAAIVAGLCVSLPAQSPRKVRAGDWPELRGPNRDGISVEKGLISTWKLNGENFLWRVPGGGRSTPIVMGNRVYVQQPTGRGPQLQERILALDADTGKTAWEYRFNLFQSVGLARGRSRDGQHLRAERRSASDRTQSRGQTVVGPLVR